MNFTDYVTVGRPHTYTQLMSVLLFGHSCEWQSVPIVLVVQGSRSAVVLMNACKGRDVKARLRVKWHLPLPDSNAKPEW